MWWMVVMKSVLHQMMSPCENFFFYCHPSILVFKKRQEKGKKGNFYFFQTEVVISGCCYIFCYMFILRTFQRLTGSGPCANPIISNSRSGPPEAILRRLHFLQDHKLGRSWLLQGRTWELLSNNLSYLFWWSRDGKEKTRRIRRAFILIKI